MAGNINHEMMYFPHAPGAPPPPVVNPPVVPQAVVPQAVGQEPQPAQQPVENDDNIAGAPPAAEPLFIGPHNLVGPRLPPIEDIVANDPEIRRICSEISTIINDLIGINKEKIMYIATRQSEQYHILQYNLQQYWQPPFILEGWGNITENTLLRQIKWYVKMATHLEPNRRHGFNFQAAIVGLENSI
jgi:hypothetical protein